MYLFLIPLLVGFALNSGSEFTTAFCRRWGERRGRLATVILRNVLGIPLWVVGVCLAVRVSSPMLFVVTATTEVLAWLLVAVGSVVILAALVALRVRAAMPSTRDTLVEHGLYAHVRHPIYAAMLLEFAGIVLMRPTRAVGVSCALGVAWLYAQARCEEFDLLQRVPG